MKTRNYLSSTDLSEFLKTRRLMEAWYLLAGDDVAVLVDSVKPRILRLFAFGKFGTLQQLLYDTDGTEQDRGFYGIVPTYTAGGKTFYPFVHRATDFTDNGPSRLEFDDKNNRLRMQGIRTFDDDRREGGKLDLTVSLAGSKLSIQVRFPEAAEECRLTSHVYPLYTHYRSDTNGTFVPVEYFQYGFQATYSPWFDQVVGRGIELRDRQGRMPGLRVRSADHECRLISQADRERSNAFRLSLTVMGRDRNLAAQLELLPNAVTVHSPPSCTAGGRERIEIRAKEKPTVTVDGRPVATKAKGRGIFEIHLSLAEGKHALVAENRRGRSMRTICTVGDPAPKLIAMGKAVCRLPWPSGPVKNLMPYFYWFDPLEPARRGETPDGAGAYGSHSLRAYCILAAAALLTRDRTFVDRGFESLEAVIKKAHRFDDGDLLLPHEIDAQGKPYLLNATRPSDLGLMVRALLYMYRGFDHFKDRRKKEKCLAYAWHFAHTLTKMQQPNGSFYPRYHYPDLGPHPSEPMGTVNNWAIQIWELGNLFEATDAAKAKELKDICLRHADFLLAKTPSMLRLTGGGEDPPNYMDGLSSSALFLMIKHLATGDEKYRRWAEESFLMGALTTTIFIDQPNNFFCAHSPWLPEYYNQPPLPNKGGMHDLTMIEAGLFLGKYLGSDFGRYVASCNFANRLIDSVQPNGAICGMIVEAPNYRYRRKDAGETLDYGCVGIYGFDYAVRNLAKGR